MSWIACWCGTVFEATSSTLLGFDIHRHDLLARHQCGCGLQPTVDVDGTACEYAEALTVEVAQCSS